MYTTTTLQLLLEYNLPIHNHSQAILFCNADYPLKVQLDKAYSFQCGLRDA